MNSLEFLSQRSIQLQRKTQIHRRHKERTKIRQPSSSADGNRRNFSEVRAHAHNEERKPAAHEDACDERSCQGNVKVTWRARVRFLGNLVDRGVLFVVVVGDMVESDEQDCREGGGEDETCTQDEQRVT